jgi:hypothetical protein
MLLLSKVAITNTRTVASSGLVATFWLLFHTQTSLGIAFWAGFCGNPVECHYITPRR